MNAYWSYVDALDSLRAAVAAIRRRESLSLGKFTRDDDGKARAFSAPAQSSASDGVILKDIIVVLERLAVALEARNEILKARQIEINVKKARYDVKWAEQDSA
ncbi:MAG: hypothetical protein O9972_19355 [Burkholderiales bacterium]|nr:hypothetical protein [Burkholderiales bacterium]